MKVDEEKLGCDGCCYRTGGDVCNICWKRVCEKFYKEREKKNAETHKRISKKDKGN